MMSVLRRDPQRSADAEIKGAGRVNHWPPNLHLCLQQPIRLTEEALNNGLEIGGHLFSIKGLVHHRGEGDWSVSVNRIQLGGWHILGKDSEPQRVSDRVSLLSGVVLIQLSKEQRCSQDDAAGIFFSQKRIEFNLMKPFLQPETSMSLEQGVLQMTSTQILKVSEKFEYEFELIKIILQLESGMTQQLRGG